MKSLVMVGMVLALTFAVQGAEIINYSQDFENVSSLYPLNGTAQCDYWLSGNYGGNNAYFGSTVLWYAGNPGGNATQINALRNFEASGQLASGESFSAATVGGYFFNPGAWNDGRIQSAIGILDNAGNGYMGVATYGGSTMYIFELTNGTPGSSPLAGKQFSGGLVNQKTLTLDVQENGAITFSVNAPGLSDSITATDATYSNFTQIVMGGQVVLSEQHVFDNVTFAGTVVPEPATLAILLLGLAGVVRKY